MKDLSRIAVAALAILSTGCDTVSSPVPLGTQPAVVDASEWDGRWSNAEGEFNITVIDSAAGLIRIDYVEDDETRMHDLQLREANGWLFANISEADFDDSQGLGQETGESPANPDEETPGSDNYLWARLVKNTDMIIAWPPAADKFVPLVRSGRIPGQAEEGSVVLGALNARHYDILTSEEFGVLLDWEHPTVLYRIGEDNPAE